MEAKGWLHPDGKVRWVKEGSIAEVGYKETRYNLRRVFVMREWGFRFEGEAFVWGFDTRKEAVASALYRKGLA